MSIEIGSRVGALLKANKEAAYFFGYGVYEGDHYPPGREQTVDTILNNPDIKWPNDDLEHRRQLAQDCIDGRNPIHNMLYRNPRIRLDNGQIVWGMECWWGSEADMESRFKDLKIINVSFERDSNGVMINIQHEE